MNLRTIIHDFYKAGLLGDNFTMQDVKDLVSLKNIKCKLSTLNSCLYGMTKRLKDKLKVVKKASKYVNGVKRWYNIYSF